MKRTKLLLSAIVSLLLACVMTFSLAACNNKATTPNITQKPDVPDKSAGDLGITDSSEEDWALLYIEIVTVGQVEFDLGEEFSAAGLNVRAVYLNPEKQATIEDIEGNIERMPLYDGDYVVDSSDYNPNKVGIYTIYVSYTFEGVTATATYNVSVKVIDPEIGGIVAMLADGKEDTITLSATSESATVTKDIVSVYRMEVNEDGKAVPAADPIDPEEYDVKLYLGSKLIENNQVTENGVYSLVAYLVEDENNQDFIPVYVINPVTKIELDESAGGKFEQSKSMRDTMTSTWQFTVTYANGTTKTIKGGAAGLTIKLDTNTIADDQIATVTYVEKDGKGVEHTVTCEVTYSITEFAGEPVNYSVTYGVTSDGSTYEWVTTWANGEEDFDGAVTVDVSGLKTGNTGTKTTEDGSHSFDYSYEFKAANNLIITVSEAASNVVIKYYVSHGNATATDRTASVTKGGETITEVTPLPHDGLAPYVEIMTVEATAGTYVLTANNTMRVYMVEISYTSIPGSVVQKETLKYRPEVGNGYAYAGDLLLENDVFRATLSENSEVVSYVVESNSKATTEGTTLTTRLKFAGGIDTANNEDVNNETTNKVKNAIKIEAAEACTLTFYVRSSSSGASRLFQGYTFDEASGKLFPLTAGLSDNVNTELNDLVYVLTFEIEAGTYYFGSASSGVGIYGLDVVFS